MSERYHDREDKHEHCGKVLGAIRHPLKHRNDHHRARSGHDSESITPTTDLGLSAVNNAVPQGSVESYPVPAAVAVGEFTIEKIETAEEVDSKLDPFDSVEQGSEGGHDISDASSMTFNHHQGSVHDARRTVEPLKHNTRFSGVEKSTQLARSLRVAFHKFEENHEHIHEALVAISKIHPVVKIALAPFVIAMKLYMHWRKTDNAVTLLYCVKLWKSFEWAPRFTGFSQSFQRRSSSLQLRIAAVTVTNVNNVIAGMAAMKLTIDAIGVDVKSLNDREKMLMMFDACRSPKEMELQRRIESRRGLDQWAEKDFAELVLASEKIDSNSTALASLGSQRGSSEEIVKKLVYSARKQLRDDVDTVLAKNEEVFERKFRSQMKDIEDEIHNESDRIIRSLSSGSHDRIVDPELRRIWKEMKWKGIVKARHFVVAVQSHYTERLELATQTSTMTQSVEVDRQTGREFQTDSSANDDEGTQEILRPINAGDRWALQYIDIVRLQPLIEALDDDASGFISVQEANHFSDPRIRPKSWSLAHWMAYWAAGFPQVLFHYHEKIKSTLCTIFHYKDQVLPANRALADRFLGSCAVLLVDCLLKGIEEGLEHYDYNEKLYQKFSDHVDSEEERLRVKLEDFKFHVDAPNTLHIITGRMRLETYIAPVLYLLLDRLSTVMRLAQSYTLDERELSLAGETLSIIWRCTFDRISGLKEVFKQQNHNPSRRLQNYAYGMLYYLDRPDSIYEEGFYDYIVPEHGRIAHAEREAPLALKEWMGILSFRPLELALPVSRVHVLLATKGANDNPLISDAAPSERATYHDGAVHHTRTSPFRRANIASFGTISGAVMHLHDPRRQDSEGHLSLHSWSATVDSILRFARTTGILPHDFKNKELKEFLALSLLHFICDDGWAEIMAMHPPSPQDNQVLKELPPQLQLVVRFVARRVNIHFLSECAQCDQRIIGTRYLCLECTETAHIVNICRDCRGSSFDVMVDRQEMHHSAKHRLLKLRHYLHMRDSVWVTDQAWHMMHKVDQLLRRSEAIPDCAFCAQPLSRPCWFCTTCKDPVFMCQACDIKLERERPWLFHDEKSIKGKSENTATHDWTHPMLSCSERDKPELAGSVESRLAELESATKRIERLLVLLTRQGSPPASWEGAIGE
ncbi:hypothetical protein OE88DRAFT_1736072 [Heliocybe sulcata]|uniref:ZZ-type domain-containing protein n=1 Tax=Heliocybe sulcata TaxID=5364 RepID=A0A5C3N0J2_9AGAM|nr:hypothetical protein OE88DRAFT_1736072 [Heliocybe sulcata]